MAEVKTDAVSELVRLLSESRARVVVRPGRTPASPIYDLEYRIMVTSCAFDIHAATLPRGLRRMRTAELKLVQFVAVRPWVLGVIREWSTARRDAQLSALTSDRLRRGFLSDHMHDRVVDYLVAARVFMRADSGKHVIEAERGHLLRELHALAASREIFQQEREVLTALRQIKITNEMLEGL